MDLLKRGPAVKRQGNIFHYHSLQTKMAMAPASQNAQNFSGDLWLRKGVTEEVTRQAHEFWTHMTLDTTPHKNTDRNPVMNNLKTVDDISTDKTKPYWQRRLAYLQLHRMLEILKQIVAHNRRQGKLDDRPPGKGNSTVVLEIYAAALHGKSLRHVDAQKRLAKRWCLALNNSLFLALSYTDHAEKVMFVTVFLNLATIEHSHLQYRKNFAVTHETLRTISQEATQEVRQRYGFYKVFPI